MANKLSLLALMALGLFWLVACGHVTFGSSSSTPVSPIHNDWQYQQPYWPSTYSDGYAYHSASSPTLSDPQAGLYQALSRDLSDTLTAYQQVGVAGFSHVWPLLDGQRIKLLNLQYDRFSQILRWDYENIGDFDLNGVVNSVDLIPVVRYAEPSFVLSREEVAYRNWLDTDGNGLLDRHNAQLIAMSYGRGVCGYNVLAGASPDPATMDSIGVMRLADRLPGLPGHFELLVPSGYSYICIQPLKHGQQLIGQQVASQQMIGQQVICSYIAQLIGKPDNVTVQYPDKPVN